MKRLAAALLLSLTLSCDSGSTAQPPAPAPPVPRDPPPAKAQKAAVDKKGRGKNPELFKKYYLLMESTEAQSDLIKEDVDKKLGDAAIKPRLAQIRKNLETARALQYRKDPDEAEQLDGFFNVFLEAKLKHLEETSWTSENGPALWESLQTACSTCHGVLRD